MTLSSKPRSKVPEDQCQEKSFTSEKIQLSVFSYFQRKNFRTVDSFLGSVVKTAIIMSIWTNLGNSFFSKKVIFICRTLGENSYGPSAKTIHQVGQNTVRRNPRNFSTGNFFPRKTLIFNFFGILLKFLWFIAEKFQQCCQNCTPCVQSNNLSGINFRKKLFSFSGFEQKLSGRWRIKLSSTDKPAS